MMLIISHYELQLCVHVWLTDTLVQFSVVTPTCCSSERHRRLAGASTVPALHCAVVGRTAGERNLKVGLVRPIRGDLKQRLGVPQQTSS